MSGRAAGRMFRSLAARLRIRSLRGRLTAGVVLLFAVACGIVGVATTLSLRGFLLDRLDQQLMDAGNRFAVSVEHGGDQDVDDVHGQSIGTFGARVAGGQVTQSGVVSEHRRRVTLSAGDTARLLALPAGRGPRSLRIDSLGDYRMMATPGQDGDVLITGLPLHGVDDVLHRLEIIEAVVYGAVLAGSAAAASTLVRLTLRPLRRVAATATHVSELPLASGEVALPARVPGMAPDTETGQVGTAFNHMLEHVEAALAHRHASEERLRRFIADASHELRTPLAGIRSHAELARRAEREAGPGVRHALDRIESESARMGHLVDDLLLLARLDAGRPLAREPVDLTRLAIDTTSDARAAGPDHRWTLDLPEEPVTVHGDRFRLHEILANLLGNARTHTPAGTTVTVRVVPADGTGTVTVEVTDDGPGIPAGLQGEVFERFVRGDGSRSRKAGGTGLGLAIVSAVVQAHGGTVRLSSEPGRTRFRILLPEDTPSGEAGDGAEAGASRP